MLSSEKVDRFSPDYDSNEWTMNKLRYVLQRRGEPSSGDLLRKLIGLLY